jgi:hypothetical protein
VACHHADGTAGGGRWQALRVTEVLLIMKHGGVLTHTGRMQAEQAGRHFRSSIYPQYGPSGGGLLRLHSTYRHDLKIYSSDEGRVQVRLLNLQLESRQLVAAGVCLKGGAFPPPV